jgi:hypothetical protein
MSPKGHIRNFLPPILLTHNSTAEEPQQEREGAKLVHKDMTGQTRVETLEMSSEVSKVRSKTELRSEKGKEEKRGPTRMATGFEKHQNSVMSPQIKVRMLLS